MMYGQMSEAVRVSCRSSTTLLLLHCVIRIILYAYVMPCLSAPTLGQSSMCSRQDANMDRFFSSKSFSFSCYDPKIYLEQQQYQHYEKIRLKTCDCLPGRLGGMSESHGSVEVPPV